MPATHPLTEKAAHVYKRRQLLEREVAGVIGRQRVLECVADVFDRRLQAGGRYFIRLVGRLRLR